jgi:molecular chaperone HscB
MQADNRSNYFKWFDLPIAFDLNLNDLQQKYYALSKKMHPDNFKDKSKFEVQLAQQALQHSHKAYEVLHCPIKRANYILFLNNIDISSEAIQQQPLSPAFLEQIFDWQMQDMQPDLKLELEQNCQTRMQKVIEFLNTNQFELALPLVREILFIQKVKEQS